MAVNEKPHRKLKVWQASMDFVADLYQELEKFPAHERFGIGSQLRRAAVSIPNVARGSLSEIDTQLEICLRVGHFERAVYERFANRLEEMSKMLNGLIMSVAKSAKVS